MEAKSLMAHFIHSTPSLSYPPQVRRSWSTWNSANFPYLHGYHHIPSHHHSHAEILKSSPHGQPLPFHALHRIFSTHNSEKPHINSHQPCNQSFDDFFLHSKSQIPHNHIWDLVCLYDLHSNLILLSPLFTLLSHTGLLATLQTYVAWFHLRDFVNAISTIEQTLCNYVAH